MRMDWHVEAMRITVFPSDLSVVDMPKLWNSVLDQEPDAIHFQKEKIDAREVGFGNGRMVLARQTDRIDWHYLSNPDANADNLQLPIIGRLSEELNPFAEFANSWLVSPDMLSTRRLAYGAVLLFPVDSVEEGFSILQLMLPRLALKNVRDFHYQINRRRNSTVDAEIELNRLSKWNVITGQLVTVEVDPMQKQQVSTTTGLSIACRLELDINTVPERTDSLPQHSLTAIFSELIELGLEISERGDTA